VSNRSLRRRQFAIRFAVVAAVVVGAAFVGASGRPAFAQEHGHSHEGAKAEPGPYRATSERRFDNVEHWTKVFDDPERDEWQKPRQLVGALQIGKGDTVADLGAGTGYLLPFLVEATGKTGTVFAVDVEPTLVEHLRERAEALDARNVVPVLASLDDARLPDGSADLILILDTFHHLDDRLHYFERLENDLAENGRIAIVDWKKEPLPEGPPPPHKISRERVVTEMQAAGFRAIPVDLELPYHYLVLFEPAPKKATDSQ
jgi:ubiquinone/menaquinone biosynthesis C-methylase UbiE